MNVQGGGSGVIMVLGMHRSGTSAMTRGLGFLGVALGEDFIPEMPEVNAKGFWEDASLLRVNIEVLETLGMDWLTLRKVPEERLQTAEFEPLVNKAAELLNKKIPKSGRFGFKDPRTTMLLPFWKLVVNRLGVKADAVIAIRHPSSVAESLRKRNGFRYAKSEMLWLRYTVAAMRDSAMMGRQVLVDYDDMLEDPAATLRGMAESLGLAAPTIPAVDEFSKVFIDGTLRHCRQDEGETEGGVACRLYRALRTATLGEHPGNNASIAAAVTDAENLLADNERLLAYVDEVEYAAALGKAAREGEFPWLGTLRKSYGIADAGLPADMVDDYKEKAGGSIRDRLKMAISRVIG